MLRAKDVLFGEIALALKMLSRDQLTECIEYQEKKSPRTRLGVICQRKGYMSPAEVERVLDYQVALVIKQRRG